MSFLYKFPPFFIGPSFLFVYWDKKAQVLEFYLFGKVVYLYIAR